MNILHLATFERAGGACIASNRIHKGLLGINVNSTLGVLYRNTDEEGCEEIGGRTGRYLARGAEYLDKIRLKRCARCDTAMLFSAMSFPSIMHHGVAKYAPDITHLHWVSGNFFPMRAQAKLRTPVVFTMHDAWAFTGGCHCLLNCEAYQSQCGCCPELGSTKEKDLSRRVWNLKRRVYAKLNPVFVAPSRLHAAKAQRSSLLQGYRVEYIPNPVDSTVFRPVAKEIARDLLGLPAQEFIILFGALNATSDRVKGYDLLCRALQHLASENIKNVSCVVFGANDRGQGRDIPFPVRFLGNLHDEITLTLAYSAADVFVCPSRVESFSNTTLESLACGTPVVGFRVGGIPDMVEHMKNGFIAKEQDAGELAQGLAWVLQDEVRRRALGRRAREVAVDRFDQAVVAAQYLALYQGVLDNKNTIQGQEDV